MRCDSEAKGSRRMIIKSALADHADRSPSRLDLIIIAFQSEWKTRRRMLEVKNIQCRFPFVISRIWGSLQLPVSSDSSIRSNWAPGDSANLRGHIDNQIGFRLFNRNVWAPVMLGSGWAEELSPNNTESEMWSIIACLLSLPHSGCCHTKLPWDGRRCETMP